MLDRHDIVFGPWPYEAVTDGIRVQVRPTFMEDYTDPDSGQFVWAYSVKIENKGKSIVKLLRRHWHILDARGRVQEVEGEGIVGEQPVLAPGDAFAYASHTILEENSGFMGGHYELQTADGKPLTVSIPTFSLDMPEVVALH